MSKYGGHLQKLVVVGQGYVGLPLAMRAVEVGSRRRRARRRRRAGSSGSAAGESYVEDVSDDACAAALATGRYRPTHRRPTLRRLRRRRHHGADARCARARPTSRYIEDAAAHAGAATCGPAPR